MGISRSGATARMNGAATARSSGNCSRKQERRSDNGDCHAFDPDPLGVVRRWAALVERGPVLDVACGPGRHAILFAERGFEVFAVDRDDQVLPGSIHFVKANLEDGSPWPWPGKRFAAIVVTNYLHRPLFP